MRMIEEADLIFGTLEQHPVDSCSPRAGGSMESRNYCAYNQTRECFLGLEIAAANIPHANLKDMIATLALKSGEGLWLEPFRGIPETHLHFPLDLVYLDEACRVIDVVESFPSFRVSPSSPPAASVLALPTHSIYSSQTQPGDQLVLCVAEEMKSRLERFSTSSATSSAAITIQNAALLREAPLWSGGPGLLQLEGRATEQRPGSPQKYEMELIRPGMRIIKPPKNWLERWWSPDPRKAPREPAPGLAAYYWTGGALDPRSIRDISSTGLYLVTEERWYPGTLVLMTLTNTEGGEENSECSISVHSRAVRWGNDGVGFQFVLSNSKSLSRSRNLQQVNGIDKKELDRFLQQLRKDNS
jgi:hypothetical protein